MQALVVGDVGEKVGRLDAGAIRASPTLADYNVEHMQLTEDDLNDPELLAQLAALASSPGRPRDHKQEESVPKDSPDASRTRTGTEAASSSGGAVKDEIIPQQPPSTSLEELRSYALAAKRAGDMASARLFMSQIIALRDEPFHSAVVSFASSSASVDKSRVHRLGSVSGLSSPSPSPSRSSSPSSSLSPLTNAATAANRQVIRTLQKQAKECHAAAELFMNFGQSTDASDFLRRKKALEADILAIERKWTREGVAVEVCDAPVSLPVDFLDRDIPAGALKMTISNLRVLNRSVVAGGSKETFFFKAVSADLSTQIRTDLVTYERLRLGETRFDFATYPAASANDPLMATMILTFYKNKPGLFTSTKELLSTVKLDLRGLLEDKRVKMTVVMPTKDSTTPLLQFVCEARVRRPWRTDFSLPRTQARWLVCVGGETGRIFLSSPTPTPTPAPAPTPTPTPTPPLVDEAKAAEEYVADINSYVVLEHELVQLKADPTSTTDPMLLGRLTALESKLDALTVAVHLGQLSMEQYLEQVREALSKAKRRALEAKKAGNMKEAQRWMQHVIMMEAEMREAEQSEAAETPLDEDRDKES